MYGTYGLELNIQNIYSLVAPFVADDESIVKISDLKPAYIRYLQSVHPEFPIQPTGMLIHEPERILGFGQAFASSVIDDLQQEKMVGGLYDRELFNQNAALLSRSLGEMRALNPELSELFDLVVHAIMLCGSGRNQEGFRAHGGSSSKCIGLVWLNIHPEMKTRDVIEMLIHELTHTLVFLDELVHQHFNYETIAKAPYWALSSILKRQRPMDKVVHSVIVSLEILHARRNYLPPTDETKLIHPESTKLGRAVEHSIASVLDHPLLNDVCKERTVTLMQNAKGQLAQLREGAENEIAI